MEDHCTWAYHFQPEEGVEELKQSLLYSAVELEAAVVAALEEISKKDDEILQLKGLLAKIIKERDEFQTQCQQLLFQIQAHSSTEDDNNALSPSDSDDHAVAAAASPSLPLPDVIDTVPITKALPEQGKFLQAVVEAGPLLQTLLLAGPLPQWQHPPPKLSSVDIPPVTMSSSPRSKLLLQDSPTASGGFSNKRGMFNREASDFSPTLKLQKVSSPIITDPLHI